MYMLPACLTQSQGLPIGHVGEYKGMAWLDYIHKTDVEILRIREMEFVLWVLLDSTG